MTVGYLLVHQSARQLLKKYQNDIKTIDKWRIRNYIDHPVDPGWEVGLYCLCHRRIRDSTKLNSLNESPVYVIDAVYLGPRKHAIRSMFQISNIVQCKPHPEDNDLVFEKYYFAPEKYLVVQEFRELRNYMGVQHKILDENLTKKIIKKIMSKYEYLRRGIRPSTIERTDWKMMSNIAREHRGLRSHKCHRCG